MFIDCSSRVTPNPMQLNYGIAVFDADHDGQFEIAVAGFGFRNQLLKWTGKQLQDIAHESFLDEQRQAIGLAAGDFDADGQEELYVLNTDVFMGPKRFTDRLFDFQAGSWHDLFQIEENAAVLNLTAGRSACCIDRLGTGKYGFFVANYGGPMILYELNERGIVDDFAETAGLAAVTGGRSLLSLPFISDRMDLFVGNENGANFLYRNLGDGTFEEIASQLGLEDLSQHARGVAVLDAGDHFDLVCGNWEGPHRLFVRASGEGNGLPHYRNEASREFARPSRVRTVIAADFDNDGYEEIFFNNIGQPNRLFAFREGKWISADVGDALETGGHGTGAAVGDFDQDGRLELIVAHGESLPQPLSFYKTLPNENHWFRVLPKTRYGAPARGALVTISSGGRQQRRAIDAGSGYLCQMEPVAHFGLGSQTKIDRLEVLFPTGETLTREALEADQLVTLSAEDA